MNNKFKKIMEESENIVFFGGAGGSTESGIPDFRSVDGIYNQKYKYAPEYILSSSFFYKNTEEFYEFYKDKMIYLKAKPNNAHKILSELEQTGKMKAVITQNIDGLHQAAESKNVLELHGSVYRNYCLKCHKFYNIEYMVNSKGVPVCDCGSIIKPDVVLYEENLDENVLLKSAEYISNAEVLIVGGTSLGVYPAAGLLDYFKGSYLILINKSITPLDKKADLVIRESIVETFMNLIK